MLQREMKLLSATEPGDGNMCFTGVDGEPVESDDLLWTKEPSGSGCIPQLGNALDGTLHPEVEALLAKYADVFDPVLPPGGADVPPMRIAMRPE